MLFVTLLLHLTIFSKQHKVYLTPTFSTEALKHPLKYRFFFFSNIPEHCSAEHNKTQQKKLNISEVHSPTIVRVKIHFKNQFFFLKLQAEGKRNCKYSMEYPPTLF